MTPALIHSVVAIAGIIAYIVLTLTGHDGNEVLVASLAYGGGAAIQAKTGA